MSDVSSDLDLDVSSALAQVETLRDAIDTAFASTSESFTAAVTAGAQEAIATIQQLFGDLDLTSVGDALSSSLANVDAQPVTDQVSSAIDAASATPVEVGGDTGPLQGDIDAALSGAETVDVEADQAALGGSIDEAIAAAGIQTVDVDADVSSFVASVDEAVSNLPPVEVEVGADTAEAEGAIDDLGSAAASAGADASGAFGGASKGLGETEAGALRAVSAYKALDVATGLAQGQTSSLTSTLAGAGGAFGAATGGAVALGASIGVLFKAGVESQAATDRLNNAFGALAGQVQQINIGGLSGDLNELTIQAGSNDERMREAAANIGQLGKAAGASGPEVVKTTQEISALALRAVALNPSLGQAGDVADRMVRTLARGGPFAARFGIALSQMELKQRAQELGLNYTALNVYQRAALGADIATQKLSGHLGVDFARGTATAQVQLRSFVEQLQEGVERAGLPLVEPLTETFKAFVPVGVQVAELLGQVAEAVVPLITAFGPEIAANIETTGQALTLLTAPLKAVTGIVEHIPTGALKFLATFPISPVVTVGNALGVFDDNARTAATQAQDLGASLFDASGDTGIFKTGIESASNGLTQFFTNQLRGKHANDDLRDTLRASGSSVSELVTAIDGGASAWDAYSDRSARTAAIHELVARTGRSTAEAIRVFNNAGLQGAQDQAIINEATQRTNNTLDQQRAALEGAARGELKHVVASHQLSQAQVDLIVHTLRAKKGYDDWGAVLDAVNHKIHDASAATTTLGGDQETVANKGLLLGRAYVQLAADVLTGKTALTDADGAAKTLGVSAEAAAPALAGIGKAVDSFASNLIGKIPSAADALDQFKTGIDSAASGISAALGDATGKGADAVKAAADAFGQASKQFGPNSAQASSALERLGSTIDNFHGKQAPALQDAFHKLVEASSPEAIEANIAKQTAAISRFPVLIQALLSRGQVAAAQFVAQQGPIVGGDLAAKLVDEPAVGASFNKINQANINAIGATSAYLTNNAPALLTPSVVSLAEGLTGNFGSNVNFAGAAATATAAASDTLSQNTDLQAAAHTLADTTGISFKDAMELLLPAAAAAGASAASGGIVAATPQVQAAAQALSAETGISFRDSLTLIMAAAGGIGGAAAGSGMAGASIGLVIQAAVLATQTGQSFSDVLKFLMALAGGEGTVAAAQAITNQQGLAQSAAGAAGLASADSFGFGFNPSSRASIAMGGAKGAIDANAGAVSGAAGGAGSGAAGTFGATMNLSGKVDSAMFRAALAFGGSVVTISARTSGKHAGEEFGRGLANGITSQQGLAQAAAASLVQVAHAQVRHDSRSKSPSQLFAEVGADLVRGLALGMRDVREVEQVASEALANLHAVFMKSTLLPVAVRFRPKVDFSDIELAARTAVHSATTAAAGALPAGGITGAGGTRLDPRRVETLDRAIDHLRATVGRTGVASKDTLVAAKNLIEQSGWTPQIGKLDIAFERLVNTIGETGVSSHQTAASFQRLLAVADRGRRPELEHAFNALKGVVKDTGAISNETADALDNLRVHATGDVQGSIRGFLAAVRDTGSTVSVEARDAMRDLVDVTHGFGRTRQIILGATGDIQRGVGRSAGAIRAHIDQLVETISRTGTHSAATLRAVADVVTFAGAPRGVDRASAAFENLRKTINATGLDSRETLVAVSDLVKAVPERAAHIRRAFDLVKFAVRDEGKLSLAAKETMQNLSEVVRGDVTLAIKHLVGAIDEAGLHSLEFNETFQDLIAVATGFGRVAPVVQRTTSSIGDAAVTATRAVHGALSTLGGSFRTVSDIARASSALPSSVVKLGDVDPRRVRRVDDAIAHFRTTVAHAGVASREALLAEKALIDAAGQPRNVTELNQAFEGLRAAINFFGVDSANATDALRTLIGVAGTNRRPQLTFLFEQLKRTVRETGGISTATAAALTRLERVAKGDVGDAIRNFLDAVRDTGSTVSTEANEALGDLVKVTHGFGRTQRVISEATSQIEAGVGRSASAIRAHVDDLVSTIARTGTHSRSTLKAVADVITFAGPARGLDRTRAAFDDLRETINRTGLDSRDAQAALARLIATQPTRANNIKRAFEGVKFAVRDTGSISLTTRGALNNLLDVASGSVPVAIRNLVGAIDDAGLHTSEFREAFRDLVSVATGFGRVGPIVERTGSSIGSAAEAAARAVRESLGAISGSFENVSDIARASSAIQARIQVLARANRVSLLAQRRTSQVLDAEIERQDRSLTSLKRRHETEQRQREAAANAPGLSPDQSRQIQARNRLLDEADRAVEQRAERQLERRKQLTQRREEQLGKAATRAITKRQKEIDRLVDQLDKQQAAKGLPSLADALKNVREGASVFTAAASTGAIASIERAVRQVSTADERALARIHRVAERQGKKTDDLKAFIERSDAFTKLQQTIVSRGVRGSQVESQVESLLRLAPKQTGALKDAMADVRRAVRVTGRDSEQTAKALARLRAVLFSGLTPGTTDLSRALAQITRDADRLKSTLVGRVTPPAPGGRTAAEIIAGSAATPLTTARPVTLERQAVPAAATTKSEVNVNVKVDIDVGGPVSPEERRQIGDTVGQSIEARLTAAGVLAATRAGT